MKYVTKPMMNTLVVQLRSLAPCRPLSFGESLHVARLQAAHVRRWANASESDINLLWLRQQRVVPVNFVPSYHLGESSGLTTNAISGRLEMYVNEQEPSQRQRFTLLHEFKHAIDFDDAERLHAWLGSGDIERQARQIELICNEFAANVLMPTVLVKSLWFKTQDVSLCANLFNVSPEAMSKRLSVLGLVGEPKPAPRTYFRRVGLPSEMETTNAAVAA